MISYVNVKRVALRHRKESHKLSQTPFSSLPFEFCCWNPDGGWRSWRSFTLAVPWSRHLRSVGGIRLHEMHHFWTGCDDDCTRCIVDYCMMLYPLVNMAIEKSTICGWWFSHYFPVKTPIQLGSSAPSRSQLQVLGLGVRPALRNFCWAPPCFEGDLAMICPGPKLMWINVNESKFSHFSLITWWICQSFQTFLSFFIAKWRGADPGTRPVCAIAGGGAFTMRGHCAKACAGQGRLWGSLVRPSCNLQLEELRFSFTIMIPAIKNWNWDRSKPFKTSKFWVVELKDRLAFHLRSLFCWWDQDGNDDDMPLQHLRAAEQHLAALERWLRGEGRGNCGLHGQFLAIILVIVILVI